MNINKLEVVTVGLNDLKPGEMNRLSFPLRPDLYGDLQEKLAPLPLLVVNSAREIICGHDLYPYLKDRGVAETNVCCTGLSTKDALILNYNLKDKLTGLNLYEKLAFLYKVLPLAEPQEIYHKTALGISIDDNLRGKLELLCSDTYTEVLVREAVTLKTALKLGDFLPGDRSQLLTLFAHVPFSTSHQQRIVEMAEELIFRDKCPLEDIFQKLQIRALMEVEKPQKQIVDAFFKFRNPLYLEAEATWQKEIANLDLPNNITVSHYPFFEKKQLSVTMQINDIAALKKILENTRE